MWRGVAWGWATVALVGAGGCYERVVDASGFGADQIERHEPNVPNEAKDPNGPKRAEELEDTGAGLKRRQPGSQRTY